MHSDDERVPRAGLPGPDSNFGATSLIALLPVSVIAPGAPAHPVERLMGLQGGFSRLVVLLTSFRWPRPRLPRRRLRALSSQ
jgi:hypothetical protein